MWLEWLTWSAAGEAVLHSFPVAVMLFLYFFILLVRMGAEGYVAVLFCFFSVTLYGFFKGLLSHVLPGRWYT